MAARILVVEDEPAIQELIAVNLSRAGHVVQRTASAEGAQDLLNASLPDLVVLDWMLPGMSGLDFLRVLRVDRRTRSISLILLTGRAQERDMVAGLESGADDYVTKPFSVRELLARVAAVLRRRVPQVSDDAVVAGTLRLEPVGLRLISADCDLALGPTEFRLLHFLMTHADRVHSRAELLDHPLHPYTKGLLDSVPSRNVKGQPLKQIPGMTPSLLKIGSGCAFRERCSRRTSECEMAPPLSSPESNPSRRVRCFHPYIESEMALSV